MAMPASLFFTELFNQSVSERSCDYPVWGDGTPVNGGKDKDRYYWELGRMIADHHWQWGGFDSLSVCGLPAYRAPYNLQTMIGAGLSCSVKRYVGFERDSKKCQSMQDYYDQIRQDTGGQFEVDMEAEDIFTGLGKSRVKFNVYDFDMMCGLHSYRRNRDIKDNPMSVLEKRYSVRKAKLTFFPSIKLISEMMMAISTSRQDGPVAVYINLALRPLTDSEFDRMRKCLVGCFNKMFDVLETNNTRYQGNSAMAGIQMILG